MCPEGSSAEQCGGLLVPVKVYSKECTRQAFSLSLGSSGGGTPLPPC
jgi:hypothetical protein|eukprot:SAG25_NODE_190_length_12277_cov_10.004927_2_plen_47_part_00